MSISDERWEDSPDMLRQTRELTAFEFQWVFVTVYFQGYCYTCQNNAYDGTWNRKSDPTSSSTTSTTMTSFSLHYKYGVSHRH